MVKLIIAVFLFSPVFALAVPGHIGDVKVISMTETQYTIEQAGYRLVVNKEKLPSDVNMLWRKNVGKTIRSAIPYIAVAKETKIANYIPPKPVGR